MSLLNCLKNFIAYGGLFTTLFVIDSSLGNGPLNYFYNITDLIKNKFQSEMENQELKENISIPMLFVEVLILSLCMAFIHKYQEIRGHEKIDALLQESKSKLQKCNNFLDRWKKKVPDNYSYLDEEPGQVTPLKIEVPMLHMAIIDTRGTKRSQPESGDAGVTVNITDSTLLQVTSLLDDDMDSLSEVVDNTENVPEEHNMTAEFNDRQLWDLVEEDGLEVE